MFKKLFVYCNEAEGGDGLGDSSGGGGAVTQDMLDQLSSELFPETKTTNDAGIEDAVIVDDKPKDAETTTTEIKPAETTITTEKTTTDIKAPNTWKPEVAAKFTTLPEDVQQEILKREQDVIDGIGKYKVAAEYGQNVWNALQPFQAELSQNNTNPIEYLVSLATADSTIRNAATQEEKLQHFRQLANYYGITVDHGLFGAEDSTTTALRKELQELKATVKGQLTQAEAKEIAAINKMIDEFKAKPEHQYYDVLQHEMAALLQSGIAKDLKDAYDRALWANPTTRAALISKQQEDKEKATQEANKKALEDAKKKRGINVKTSSNGSNGIRKTIDQTLNDAYDSLQNTSIN